MDKRLKHEAMKHLKLALLIAGISIILLLSISLSLGLN